MSAHSDQDCIAELVVETNNFQHTLPGSRRCLYSRVGRGLTVKLSGRLFTAKLLAKARIAVRM